MTKELNDLVLDVFRALLGITESEGTPRLDVAERVAQLRPYVEFVHIPTWNDGDALRKFLASRHQNRSIRSDGLVPMVRFALGVAWVGSASDAVLALLSHPEAHAVIRSHIGADPQQWLADATNQRSPLDRVRDGETVWNSTYGHEYYQNQIAIDKYGNARYTHRFRVVNKSADPLPFLRMPLWSEPSGGAGASHLEHQEADGHGGASLDVVEAGDEGWYVDVRFAQPLRQHESQDVAYSWTIPLMYPVSPSPDNLAHQSYSMNCSIFRYELSMSFADNYTGVRAFSVDGLQTRAANGFRIEHRFVDQAALFKIRLEYTKD